MAAQPNITCFEMPYDHVQLAVLKDSQLRVSTGLRVTGICQVAYARLARSGETWLRSGSPAMEESEPAGGVALAGSYW